MRKDDVLKKRYDFSSLEFQLIEAVVTYIMLMLSYMAAKEVFVAPHADTFFVHLIFPTLFIPLLAHYKFFNFAEFRFPLVVKGIVPTVILSNLALIMFLYFIGGNRWPLCFFIVILFVQSGLLLLVKSVLSLVKRRVFGKGLHLFLSENGDGPVPGYFCRLKGEDVKALSFKDEKLEDYLFRASHVYWVSADKETTKKAILSCCSLENKSVYLIPDAFELAVKNSAFVFVDDIPMLEMESLRLNRGEAAVKRFTDIALSVLGIVVTMPLMICVALCIKYADMGPVFFTQKRVGLMGRPFNIIKFRSMVVDAEKDTGAVFAKENDHRITKIGHFIRAFRIDEIPQFFNVLAGHMSLVGPRPERPVFVEKYRREIPEYRHRMWVKPGITGLAQVKGHYTTSVTNKIRFDLAYIMNYSPWLDFKILAETIKVVFMGKKSKGFSVYGCCDDCSIL